MPLQRQHGFSLLTSTALLAAAAAGASLGAMPPPDIAVPNALSLMPLPLLGAALWLRRQRERRVARRLRGLRLQVSSPAADAVPSEGTLVFQRVSGGSWRARRDGWQAELRQEEAGPGWQLVLTRLNSVEPALPCASAATLDALLRLARGLLPGMAEPSLAALLDCDLCFPLPGGAAGAPRITVLAEGGYALRGAGGCDAVSAGQAEHLIRRGSRVPAAPF